jgi:hypothetical protein
MAKEKNKNGVEIAAQPPAEVSEVTHQLTLVNFDDIEIDLGVESEKPAAVATVEPVVIESEEDALKSVASPETLLASDPLKDKWLKFGYRSRDYADPKDKLPEAIGLGADMYNLMCDEHNLAPSNYKRSEIIKKAVFVQQACGVRKQDTNVKPQELVSIFWLVKLDRSTEVDENGVRSYAHDLPPADWFGGNLSVAVLRELDDCIAKTSKPDELDVWEYKPGFETSVRDWVVRLRNGQLTYTMVKRLITRQQAILAKQAEDAANAGKTAAEIAEAHEATQRKEHEAKLRHLGSMVQTMADFARNETGKGKADLQDYLINVGVIPGRETMEQIAARMTPGDAKLLVQSIAKAAARDRTRTPVFIALHECCKIVVQKLQAAQNKPQRVAAAG